MAERSRQVERDANEVASRWVQTNLFDYLEITDRQYWQALEAFKTYVRKLPGPEAQQRAYNQVIAQIQVEGMKSPEPGQELRKKRLTDVRRWFNEALNIVG